MNSLIGILIGLLAALGFGWMAKKRGGSQASDRIRIRQAQADAGVDQQLSEHLDAVIERKEEEAKDIDEQLQALDETPKEETVGDDELLERFKKRGY